METETPSGGLRWGWLVSGGLGGFRWFVGNMFMEVWYIAGKKKKKHFRVLMFCVGGSVR